MTYPPTDGHIALEACAGEEAGMAAKLGGKEDRVGKHKGVEEHQVLNHRQQQPWPAQDGKYQTSASSVRTARVRRLHHFTAFFDKQSCIFLYNPYGGLNDLAEHLSHDRSTRALQMRYGPS